MMKTFEVNGYVPGAGYVTQIIRAHSSASAQQVFLAQFPGGSVSYVKQLD